VLFNLPEFYQKTLNLTIADQNLKLISQSVCKAGEVEGLDYVASFTTAKAIVHARIFLVGHRSYVVQYVGPVDSENSKNALDFLNSFRVLR
jgi:hypothetical protein